VSYTSVLQRTFNLNITTRVDTDDDTQEFEFSMIDQADYAGIDDYIKAHQLQDASLAEARRAKKYNVNAAKGADKANGEGTEVAAAAEEEEESELQKAQRELEDQEDEEEEDYDPGSGGDSDGSGSSSEEDDDDDDQEGDEDGDEDEDEEGDDLVKEELGSEAEDEL
jgi:Histone chaperone Rttp106-like